jgi:hypothetical protein
MLMLSGGDDCGKMNYEKAVLLKGGLRI